MGIASAVFNTIKSRRLISRGERVLVAVSGGVDSCALLHVLIKLRQRLGIELSVCHLNHNLRAKESLRDQRFVERLAKRHGIAFYTKTLAKGSLDVADGLSMQESARAARYAFFDEARRLLKAQKVALAHNMDDQAETLLMRFLGGTSLKGLCGMPYRRGAYIRPLLDISREEIVSFAKADGIRFVDDSSNESSKYLRNKVRLELMPLIKKRFNPNVIETISRSASVLREDDDCLARLAEGALDSALVHESKAEVTLDCKVLRSLHRAISSRVLVRGFAKAAPGVKLYANHVESVIKLYEGKRPNASLSLPGNVSVQREYDRVTFAPVTARNSGFSIPIEAPGLTRIVPAGLMIEARVVKRPLSLKTAPDIAYFDLKIMDKPLVARGFEPGDVFAPFGMRGRKKLKELFMDAKLPLGMRRRVPVVVAGDDVVWVAGVRRSSLYLPEGNRALRLRLVYNDIA